MKWRQLSGPERYRVVELARSGRVDKAELCRTFGVSRQTLNKAIRAADEASMEALEPRKAGRPGKSSDETELAELRRDKERLEKKLKEAEQRAEIAKAFLDLERKLERGEPLPGEEKKRTRRKQPRWRSLKRRSATRSSGPTGTAPPMEPTTDGPGAGHRSGESAEVGAPESEDAE